MSQTRKLQSIVPDLPRDVEAIQKNGNFSDDYQLFFDQLVFGLQTNLSPEGWQLPTLTDTEIASIETQYAPYIGGDYQDMLKVLPDISGQVIFDTVNRIPKVFIITYNTVTDEVLTAAWKTFVLL